MDISEIKVLRPFESLSPFELESANIISADAGLPLPIVVRE